MTPDPATRPDWEEDECPPPMPGSERDECRCGHSRAAHRRNVTPCAVCGDPHPLMALDCGAADCACRLFQKVRP